MRKAQSEIRNIFDNYNEKLVTRKKYVSEQLTKWGNDLVRMIENHVSDQKKILDQHFEQQKRFLDTERKKFTQEVAAQEKKKDNKQIERLIAECNALKHDLPMIDQYEHPISYMRVTSTVELTLRKTDENSVRQTEENQSQNRSTEDNVNDTRNDAGASRRSSLTPTSASVSSAREGSAAIQTSSEYDSSTNSGDNAKPDVKNEDDMTDKCPVCFMIFPKSMVKQDLARHVNEHYGDD